MEQFVEGHFMFAACRLFFASLREIELLIALKLHAKGAKLNQKAAGKSEASASPQFGFITNKRAILAGDFQHNLRSSAKRMNLRHAIVLNVVLTILIGAACSKSSAPATNNAPANNAATTTTPDPFAATRGVFAKNCQTCHGPTGTGGPVKLEDGTRLKVPSLREGHALRHPDSDFVKQINKGGDGMPAFKDKLTSQQIDELVRFIRSEFQAGAQTATK
jgi:mono/diheme cytochrome c family protein